MKILVIAPDYPKPGSPIGGIFNERSVAVLTELGNSVKVLVPRPYAPPMVSTLVPRWKIYRSIPAFEVKNRVSIHRPAYPQIPKFFSAFWMDSVAYLFCRSLALSMHHDEGFDAILSFDLAGAGGLAWRIGRDLGIPASGWATGGDVRFPVLSAYGKNVARTIRKLDVVFYQSHELLEKAAALISSTVGSMARDRHVILPRGITSPSAICKAEIRSRIRAEWGLTEGEILIMSIGRISREKGAFDLIDAISLAAARDKKLKCVMVGSDPAFDETVAVQQYLSKKRIKKEQILIRKACTHDKVWEYLCAADIFAFTSYHEGMPNSLLEAMVMEVPSVAFAIPPVLEIASDAGGIVLIPPFDSHCLGESILRLASQPEERLKVGFQGKQRVMARFMADRNMAEAVRRLQSCRNPRGSIRNNERLMN